VLRNNTRSELFNWGARIFPREDRKVVDSAEGLWWKRKGAIVECRDGVSKRAESGGAGRKKRGPEDGKKFLERF
jgi:hypothetical protein